MIQIPQYESNISVEELVGEQDEINGRESSRQKKITFDNTNEAEALRLSANIWV